MIPNNTIRMQSLVTISSNLMLLLCLVFAVDLAADEIRPSSSTEESTWQLKIDKHNVQVYTRATPSGYSEVKAVTAIKALPENLLSLLDNVAIADQWIDKCKEIKLIDKPSANERIVHSYFYTPWPIKNRDMVTHSKTVFEDSGFVKIIVSDYTANYPARDDYVRMENVRGQWTMRPIDSGQMIVSYQGYGEPSGKLPIWLANNLVKSSTYNTFKQMRTLLEENNKKGN